MKSKAGLLASLRERKHYVSLENLLNNLLKTSEAVSGMFMNEHLNKSQINPFINPGFSAAIRGQHPITAENKRSHCRQPHWRELTALHIYSGGLLNWHFAWCAVESISTHKSIKAHTSACDAEHKKAARGVKSRRRWQPENATVSRRDRPGYRCCLRGHSTGLLLRPEDTLAWETCSIPSKCFSQRHRVGC